MPYLGFGPRTSRSPETGGTPTDCATEVHAVRLEHYTPVQRLALSGDGALDARSSVVRIAPAFLGLKRGTRSQIGGSLNIEVLRTDEGEASGGGEGGGWQQREGGEGVLQISQLVEDVQRLQANIAKLQESSAAQIARLEEQLDLKRQHVARLEARLDAQRDYDDLKRQLSILRSVDCPAGMGNPGEISIKSLELLLLERTKALQQSDNSSFKATSSCNDNQGITTTSTTTNSTTSHHMVDSHPHSLTHPLDHSVVPPPPPPSAPPTSVLFPPPLQNVETFGSFLGEEIVANWRRSLERTILSQSHAAAISSSVHQQLQQPHQPIVSLHSPTDPPQTTSSTPNPPTPQQPTAETDNMKLVESSGSPNPLSSVSTASSGFTTTTSPPSISLVNTNTTSTISSPLAVTTYVTTNSTILSGPDGNSSLHNHHLVNGNPKTPPEVTSSISALCNNISSPHLLTSCLSGNSLSVSSNVNNSIAPPPTNTPVSSGLSYFRSDDSMKSPFRFDDPRSPFRFTEEGGAITPSGVMVGRLGESLIPKGDPMEARLQEMLRYNMDKYSTQNLDTLHISRRVRELLSINNIGQRLFAKYVLGLSQGTVSELLSKPKPWDKLTEKGRDSYRKMHAWACDENAVLLLKSLIPKKGKNQLCY
ncbi:hypothetical protein PR048_013663 [Dryococelus australis]|uniref:CUT domain-containing protein n=1 Tax=Dryococelus australis TaxID=614101 RepID=A0ABQ9HST7_9NEOP|nr:hypothetical protein PR048_013663 [Dryococelus australis]